MTPPRTWAEAIGTIVGIMFVFFVLMVVGLNIFQVVVELVTKPPLSAVIQCGRDDALPIKMNGHWYCVKPTRAVDGG